jgi:hypothetical protein
MFWAHGSRKLLILFVVFCFCGKTPWPRKQFIGVVGWAYHSRRRLQWQGSRQGWGWGEWLEQEAGEEAWRQEAWLQEAGAGSCKQEVKEENWKLGEALSSKTTLNEIFPLPKGLITFQIALPTWDHMFTCLSLPALFSSKPQGPWWQER